MLDLDRIGADWLRESIGELTDSVTLTTPAQFCVENRYLPKSVSPAHPGPFSFKISPFMEEIVDCFDVDSPVREVSLLKGVQVAATTALESIAFYYMAHIRTLPIMYLTATKELADARVENNFIPMLVQSGFRDIIQASDEGNTKATGKTKHHIQFAGGGYFVPLGTQSASKLRQYSIAVSLRDELDGWPEQVGKDGCPDKLSDGRLAAYWDRRKIYRASTPLLKATSKIYPQYLRGDQRVYRVLCFSCGKPSAIRFDDLKWDLDDGQVIQESVRYVCPECGHEHFEYDKERLFSKEGGAHWHPTARPVDPNIRSYYLPATYSPIGFQPWHKCVAEYLEAYDPVAKQTKDVAKYQVFHNNVLGLPFEERGGRATFQMVSAHRRAAYRSGEIPNGFAQKFAGSRVLFMTATVDVHKENLKVLVTGWARNMIPFIIEYRTLELEEGEKDIRTGVARAWGRLRTLLEEHTYTADDGCVYRINMALVDASDGASTDTVIRFCRTCPADVFPVMGRAQLGARRRVQQFAPFKTKAGTVGYQLDADFYKDRLSPVIRREWFEEDGQQPAYHLNAPIDIEDKQLLELTTEYKRLKKVEANGRKVFEWYRPNNHPNELWDLLVYAHGAMEIAAWQLHVEHFKQEEVDEVAFWDMLEKEKLYFKEPKAKSSGQDDASAIPQR